MSEGVVGSQGEASERLLGPVGIAGSYGPNDRGYLTDGCRRAAKTLVNCSLLWSEGHYAHSNARVMPSDHPIAVALTALAEHDREICKYANVEHDPKLFAPYVPSIKNQTRWDEIRKRNEPVTDGPKNRP